MGGNTSKSSVQQTSEFFNKTINSFISENTQKVNATGILVNSASFKRANFKGCGVKVSQNIDATVTATGQLDTQDILALTTKLKTDTEKEIDNAASQKNGFLTTAIANNSEARTNLKTKVTNIIENTMKSSSVQEIFANMNARNATDFDGLNQECYAEICKIDPSLCIFTLDQNIKAEIVAKGVSAKLTQALADTIAENTEKVKVKQSASLENLGLESMQAGIIASVIACVCCLLILVGAFVMLGQSDAGQNVIRARGGGGV